MIVFPYFTLVLNAPLCHLAYILAQVMGGVSGAAVVYGNYARAIDIFEGGHGVRTLATGGLFATFAVSILIYLSIRQRA